MEKDEDILILILELMEILSEGETAPTILLGTQVLGRLNKHLQSNNAKIRYLSAVNIGCLSYNVKGKEKTIEAQSIPLLCNMLNDEHEEIRTAATRALASLA